MKLAPTPRRDGNQIKCGEDMALRGAAKAVAPNQAAKALFPLFVAIQKEVAPTGAKYPYLFTSTKGPVL